MKEYKALVRNEQGRVIEIISSYPSKRDFYNDLKANGYKPRMSLIRVNK